MILFLFFYCGIAHSLIQPRPKRFFKILFFLYGAYLNVIEAVMSLSDTQHFVHGQRPTLHIYFLPV